MEQPKILVVGSINMDLFVKGAHRIPSYGETIRCGEYGFASFFGVTVTSYIHALSWLT